MFVSRLGPRDTALDARPARPALRRLLTSQPRHPARADARESAFLIQAAEKGYEGVVEELLTAWRHPARAAAQDNAAVRAAVNLENEYMCEMLVQQGADARLLPRWMEAHDSGPGSDVEDDRR